jgi:hypothetical protein
MSFTTAATPAGAGCCDVATCAPPGSCSCNSGSCGGGYSLADGLLDEQGELYEPEGLGSQSSSDPSDPVPTCFSFTNALQRFSTVSASGAVDWNGDGVTTDSSLFGDLNPADHNTSATSCGGFGCVRDQAMQGHTDWADNGSASFAYRFQCDSRYLDGAGVAGAIPIAIEASGDQLAAAHILLPQGGARIAIRPGSATHWIAPSSATPVPAVIYGSSSLDVMQIDITTLVLGGAPATSTLIGDVDNDGALDLTAEFLMSQTSLGAAATRAAINFSLFDSQVFDAPGAVTVVPSAGPVVTLKEDGSGYSHTLWPPDNALVALTLADCVASAVDRSDVALSPDGAGRVLRILADEPVAAGAMAIGADGSSFTLARSRLGGGDGRVYTIVFTESDALGDITQSQCRVQVPHDQSGKAALDSGEHACIGTGC